MSPEPMSQVQLLLLIAGLSTLVVGVTVAMFVVFARFLNKEKRAGENFRSVHRDD